MYWYVVMQTRYATGVPKMLRLLVRSPFTDFPLCAVMKLADQLDSKTGAGITTVLSWQEISPKEASRVRDQFRISFLEVDECSASPAAPAPATNSAS